ncbi:MAG TPA: RMD1 family protein [Candidatus Polarisedimenticolaceae bacterium]|nr:RMD1 family protein [Candidatus Polarisedimenticolaceae bacterium]
MTVSAMSMPQPQDGRSHSFVAVAYVDDLPLSWIASLVKEPKSTPHELRAALPEGGEVFAFPFGALVFRDVEAKVRDAFLASLHARHPRFVPNVVREEFSAFERPGARVGLAEGRLVVDRMSPSRAAVVALIVAQSAAMETYERIVEDLFGRTRTLVERLERRGIMPLRTRLLHRFIGEAVGRRSEVLSTLHLLDKPDATWDDPAMDRIYDDLRGEFDLGDRFEALEAKLRAVQDALELLLGVARDRRLVWLEAAIVGLICLELVLGLLR